MNSISKQGLKMSIWHTGMFGNYKILDEQVCPSLDIGANSGTTF
jgi:hypothetical protein